MPTLLLEAEKLRNLHSGLGQFCLHLATSLAENRPDNWHLQVAAPAEAHAMTALQESGTLINTVRTLRRIHKLIPLVPQQPGLWHASHQASAYPPPRRAKVAYTFTLHDLIKGAPDTGLDEAKRLRFLAGVQARVNRAAGVAFISEYTQREAHRLLTFPANVVQRVIYNGVTMASKGAITRPATLPPNVHQSGFLFFVGIVDARKNIGTCIDMLPYLPDIPLVIAGNANSPYAQHCRQRTDVLGVAKRVHWLGQISDAEKAWCLASCAALVFPSLMEGFGIPVIEAMHTGSPVVLSPLGALPEVGGALAAYFPQDFAPEAMAAVTRKAMAQNTPADRQARTSWSHQFSQSRAAQQYWAFFQDAYAAYQATTATMGNLRND